MNLPNLRIIVPALISVLCLTGCIPMAKAGFSRYHRGDTSELSVALYSGYPPADYPYQSLGAVRGEYRASQNEMVGNSTEKALDNLVEDAKTKGANAVINIKLDQQLRTYTYTGEAVIFDSVPFSKRILIGDVL